MTAYWLMFLVPAGLSLRSRSASAPLWWLLGLMLVVLVGLRYQVGGDWHRYIYHLWRMKHMSLAQAIEWGDPGYYLVNWLVANAGLKIWLVNLASALLFGAGLMRFCRTLTDPLLALAIAVPYMVIVLAMGYTRQAAAFGLVLWALVYLRQERQLAFALSIGLAVTFHKSAALMLPLAALASTRNRVWTAVWVCATAYACYLVFLAERVDGLFENYVRSDYSQQATGGPVRVWLNALPAALYLLFHRFLVLSQQQRKLWFWMAALSLSCLPLVYLAPTPVDRVALYFMPIQLFVWSELPAALEARYQLIARLGILSFYALVLFVWLNYATHASAWLPYRLWPL